MASKRQPRPPPENVEARPVSGSPEDFMQVMQELRDAIKDNGKILGRINVGILTGTRDLEKSVKGIEDKLDSLAEAIGQIMYAIWQQSEGDQHTLGNSAGRLAGQLLDFWISKGHPPATRE